MQTEIGQCELCRKRFPEIAVNCPPGRIPPEGPPPNPVRVLFIGVAPPEKGRHFYTDPQDNLRRGLFRVLKELGRPCDGFDDLDFTPFLNNHFFLLHTAKCAIRATTRPSLPVSQFCASHHLKREIETLLPEAVCWLSSNVGHPVCQSLSREWGATNNVPFGKVTPVHIMGRSSYFIATNWPGRGWEKDTKAHLSELFKML